jgi:hypothetical protein
MEYNTDTGKDLLKTDFEIDHESDTQIRETVKWARFVSITILVLCSLALLIILLVGGSNASIMGLYSAFGSGMGAVGGGVVVVLFFLALIIKYVLVLMFANQSRSALDSGSPESFKRGLGSLKVFLIIAAIMALLLFLSSIQSTITLFTRKIF